MKYEAHGAPGPLHGEIRVPGDKSISHRSVLFAAMAQGTSELAGVLDSADVRSSIAAVQALGVAVDVREGEYGLDLTVTGWGESGPQSPTKPIDCGNSGTTVRLLMGMLAGWPGVEVTLTGDESLSTRPMRRVIDPLEQMGASIDDTDGHLPVTVHGTQLTGIEYTTPVPSAQVKSAVLLAGLRAQGTTTVTETAPSRDHTERMLPTFGVGVWRDEAILAATVEGPQTLAPAQVTIPADPSSAAFMACAAAIVPDSEITLRDVVIGPTRTGFLGVLQRMGAEVGLEPDILTFAEEAGDIVFTCPLELKATRVRAREIPSLVDEIPVLAVVATQAQGTTVFEDVGELRVKESDRLAAIVDALSAMGANVSVTGDNLIVAGPTPLHSAEVDSLGDHRLAMAWAIAGLVTASGSSVTIERFEAVEVSYPGFVQDLKSLGA